MSDAIVIGGGVMGLGMARELRRRGLSVTLLERAQPRRDGLVSIAFQRRDAAGPVIRLLAAREDRDVVAACQREIDEVPAEKARAAENQ